MIKPTYFIYLHRRMDTMDVFYIGKGTRTHKAQYVRAYVVKKRSSFWNAIVSKAGYSVELVADFFNEDDAFAKEKELIEEHGRKCEGGTLCNLTTGGEGHSGLPMSDDARAKLSARNTGKGHFNWGKKLSKETCKNKSESMKSSPLNLSGKKLPDWWKQKIAATKVRALNPMYGKTGADHPNSRKVRDVANGNMYDSVQIAADATGQKMKTLYNWLSGHRKNPTTLEFA